MKSILVMIALLAGTSSFACDALIGTWACTSQSDQEGTSSSTDTYAKVDGGISITTTDVDGTSTTIVDGKPHTQTAEDGSVMTYTASLTCKDASNGAVAMNMKVQIGDQSIDAALNAGMAVSGNQLTVTTTGTASSGGQNQNVSNIETCTKQ